MLINLIYIFFTNIGPNLASKINSSNRCFKEFLPPCNISSMYLETVTETEIEKIVVSLKNGAPGYDEITTDCIKSTIKDLSAPLAFLINLSFRDGLFPDEMKTAKVVPLYKANDPTVFSNYRPVSILPVFSKILERVMYNRLIKFLKKI